MLVVEELTPSTAAGLDPAKVRESQRPQAVQRHTGRFWLGHSAFLRWSGWESGLLEVPESADVIVDGDRGIIIVDPEKEVFEQYAEGALRQAEAAKAAAAVAADRAATRDGTVVEVAANIGSVQDAHQAVAVGADGVGLLRTEFLFLERTAMPTENEQFEVFRRSDRARRPAADHPHA